MTKNHWETLLLGVVLTAALIVRLVGAMYDLPRIYHPDEPRYVEVIQGIFVRGDLNPHMFNYPSLFFYVNALAYAPFYLIGRLIGVFHAPTDILPPVILAMGTAQAQTPSAVMMGRCLTICAGTAVVGFVYWAGRRLTGRASVGLLAAAMMAVTPAAVWHSRSITPDTFVTLACMAAFVAIVHAYQRGGLRRYALAAFLVGLTASTKYNGVLIGIPLLVAARARCRHHALPRASVLLLAAVAAGFLLATPYAILDPVNFLRGVRFESRHYATGHIGMEGDTLAWYLRYMWSTGGLLYVLFVLGSFVGVRRNPKETGLLVSFPVVYFIFISRFTVRNDRTLLPLIPFVILTAMWSLVRLLDGIRRARATPLRGLGLACVVGLMIPLWRVPGAQTIADTRQLLRADSRATAAAWIERNLPAGAKIAIESYAPYVDPARFQVRSFVMMIEHAPQWYGEEGFEYLILSQGMYGRFFHDRLAYEDESEQYENLFRHFVPVMIFEDGGFEVRILRVRPAPAGQAAQGLQDHEHQAPPP